MFVGRYGARAFGPYLFWRQNIPETELEGIEPGSRLPGGLHALYDGRDRKETPLWLPEQQALVFADALTAPEGELRVWATPWHEQRVLPALRALLELPFEQVIVSHGEPVSGCPAEHVDRRQELSQELIDEPMEIGLDVQVDLLTGVLDDAVAPAPKPRQSQQVARDGLRSFLRMLPPLRSDHILADECQPGTPERGLDRLFDEVRRHDREVLCEERGLLRLETFGGEDGGDEQVSARPKDTGGLGDRWLERLDDLDDISAPDDVEGAVGVRDVLHHPFDDLDSSLQVRCGAGSCPRSTKWPRGSIPTPLAPVARTNSIS